MVWIQNLGPVSNESRLNRIYPQKPGAGITPFIYHIQSGPANFYVATGSGVVIRSSFTETLY